MSKALQNSVILSFNGMKYSKYLVECFKMLKSDQLNKAVSDMQCLILIDIAHLIKNVSRFKCFSKADSVKKMFYCKCIGYLSTVRTLEDFDSVLTAIFTVCQNQIDVASKCTHCRKFLVERIATFSSDDFKPNEQMKNIDLEKDEATISDLESGFVEENLILSHIESIRKSAMLRSGDDTVDSLDFGQELNAFYLPQMTSGLVKLCKEFPAWTNVMRAHFHSEQTVATSARSETVFAYIKGSLLDDGRSTRSDKFFILNAKLIDDTMKLTRAEYDLVRKTQYPVQTRAEKTTDIGYLKIKEAWRAPAEKSVIGEVSEGTRISFDCPLNTPMIKDIRGIDENISSSDPIRVDNNVANIAMHRALDKSSSLIPPSADAQFPNDDSLPVFYGNVKLHEKLATDGSGVNEANDIHFNGIIQKEQSSASLENFGHVPPDENTATYEDFMDDIIFQSTAKKNLSLNTSENYILKKFDENTFTLLMDHSGISTLHRENLKCVKVNRTANVTRKRPTRPNPQLKRGIYVTPDPELPVKLQKPKGKKPKGNIQNGNKLLPRVVNDRKISFENTCAFDSIVEVLASAYCNCIEFRNFVEQLSSCSQRPSFINLIREYSVNGVRMQFYNDRAHILYALRSVACMNNRLDCRTNVNSLLKKLLQDYPCTEEVLTCSDNSCQSIQKNRLGTLEITPIQIWKQGVQWLAAGVRAALENNIRYCRACNKTSADRKVLLGPYLWIDMDFIYEESQWAKQNGIANVSSSLQDIPTFIDIGVKRYLLCGVIQYVPPIIEDGLAHYVAFTRSAAGEWQERNDLVKDAKYVTPSQVNNIKISSLFYVDITGAY